MNKEREKGHRVIRLIDIVKKVILSKKSKTCAEDLMCERAGPNAQGMGERTQNDAH